MVDQYVTAPTLKSQGWTEQLIKRFMPHPDSTCLNRMGGEPVRLFLRERAESIMASDEWQAVNEEAKPRRDAARRAAETKRRQIRDYVDGVEISVPLIPFGLLVRLTCAHYNGRNVWNFATPKSDLDFLKRHMVNYLRHEQSPYETELAEMYGYVGVREGEARLRKRLFTTIAEVYPDLADECIRQLDRKHPSNMTRTVFVTWLQKQRERDDLVGDFARNAALDASFPREPGAPFSVFISHLEKNDVAPEAREAVKRAWDEWLE